MSIEFLGDDGATDVLAQLFGLKPRQRYSSDGEPLPIQHSEAMTLLADHEQRKTAAKADTDEGMLTPRITIREHSDIHLLKEALDAFMTEKVDDWEGAVAQYSVGGDANTLEDLTERSRMITEAVKLRMALDRAHKAWAEVQPSYQDEHSVSFPEDDSE